MIVMIETKSSGNDDYDVENDSEDEEDEEGEQQQDDNTMLDSNCRLLQSRKKAL